MNPLDDKYKPVWKMMKKYSFNINPHDNRDLLCVICNKVLVNVYQNECGCRFCYKCIKSYIKDNDKTCPGNTEECSKELIDISSIQADFAANKRLSAILVKCPIGNCTYTDCLIDIDSHLQSHSLDCPFALFGCCQSKYSADNIHRHLTEENSTHSKLIFECINNVKIELKNSQRLEINKIGRQFIELYENQEIKIGKLELENEEFKKLGQKMVLLELENEKSQQTNKAGSQAALENEKLKKLGENVAWLELETEELRKLDKMVSQLQLEYEEFRKFQEIIAQLHFEKSEFGKIDKKVSQIQLECEQLKLANNNNNRRNNSNLDENETKQIVEKIMKECKLELGQALDGMKKDIEELRNYKQADKIDKTSFSSPVKDRRSATRNYSQSITANSRKINENYKVKYDVICEQVSDLKKELRDLQRVQKDMKYTLLDWKKVLDSSNYSEEISQLKKTLERYKTKKIEEELNSKVIGEEFQKLKRDLKNYLSEPDECSDKFKLIDKELTEMKQSRDKLKFLLDKITIENQIIKEKLSENNKLKTEIEKATESISLFKNQYEKIDNDVKKAQKELEKCTGNASEIEAIKINCAESDKIISQCQSEVKNVTDKYTKSLEHETTMTDSLQRLKNELSKLRIDFTFSYKNLISETENVKSELGTLRSVDNNIQIQITKSNSEIAKISETLNYSQLNTNKLMIAIEEMNSVRNKLDKLQSEIKENREEIKLVKSSGENLTENTRKIIGNVELVNAAMEEFKQISGRKCSELVLSAQKETDRKQEDLVKQFSSLSKRFLNLRTECLNIKSDIATQLAAKKPIKSREWTLENFSKKLQKSKSNEEFHVTSDWFQFAGYKMSFKVYPNGDSACRNRFMSVFFFIHRLSDLVEENRKYRLTLALVDRQDQSRNFTKEYDYCNFLKEEKKLIDYSELGGSDFISLDDLRGNSRFIHNDSLIFRFIIKPS